MIATALGIVGLARFWAQQRIKQIGVRRALGAARSKILGYFQTGNFLLTTIDTMLGILGASGLNPLPMTHYELLRLRAVCAGGGGRTLVAGTGHGFGLAKRAAAVPPAVATHRV